MAKMKKITLHFEAPKKYKMDEDEVQNLLHIRRKGSFKGKDKTKFNRKMKHKNLAY